VRIRIAVPEAFVRPDVVDATLEAVTRLDEHLIRSGQSPTSHELVQQGAVWRPEPPGDEHFDHGGTIAARGWGDCDDWAPLHAATLRASGEDPGAVARVVPSGPSTYHAIVQRSDGAIEDPSVAAGMKAHRVGGIDGETIAVWAHDPHDGRIYHGQLLPTVAPLQGHCGPNMSVRGITVVGAGDLWEGRCDVPIDGSPLIRVRSYLRHKHGHGHHRHHPARRVHGVVPYAISVTGWGSSPVDALHEAVVGAILCGDAAELTTSLDRYKLLATQAAMAGHSPGEVRDMLVDQMTTDVQAAAATDGSHPRDHTSRLLTELMQDGTISGVLVSCDGYVVGDFFSDIGHIASGVVSAVQSVARSVGPWVGTIIHGIQAIVSVVPGLGTAVSDIIAAAESAYDEAAALLSGNPLEGAIKAAYNFATATIPGASSLRILVDPVVNTLLGLAFKKEPIESALLDGILSDVPDSPKIGPLSPRSVVSSLAHMLVSHLGAKQTPKGQKPAPAPAPPPGVAIVPGKPIDVHPQVMAAAHQGAAKAPHALLPAAQAAAHAKAAATRPVTAPAAKVVKPRGVPHAATHVALVLPKGGALPTASSLAASSAPAVPTGAPPGAAHWTCRPQPDGSWACAWV
jgi:hypothetical protein